MNKVKKLVEELGLVGALCYVLYRLCARSGGLASYYRYFFVAQPVLGEALLPGRRGQSIVVRQIEATDPELLSLPLNERVLIYRARQGAICFGAFKGDEIIGCLWLCLSSYEEDEVRGCFHPQPPASSSWDFDVYLKPEYRLGLGFARLWDTANGFLRQRGVAWSWSRISAFNTASLASHARLGARIEASANFLRLGPCQLMVATVPPYIHCSLRPRNVPHIRLFHKAGLPKMPAESRRSPAAH